MDGIAILRDQQADFIKRLNSNSAILHEMKNYKLTGYHSELMVISGTLLNRLQKFYSRQSNQNLPHYYQEYIDRDIFKQKLKTSFSKLIVKQYLDPLVNIIDKSHTSLAKYSGNFCLKSNDDFPIIVQGNFCSRETANWSIDLKEIDREGAIVCVLIEEDFDQHKYQYNLILSGFLPTELLDLTQPRITIKIEDLLYSGGLKSYLRYREGTLSDEPVAPPATSWNCKQTFLEEQSLLCMVISGDRSSSGQSPKLAASGLDQDLHIWDLNTGQVKQTLNQHRYPVFCLDFSPDGQTLAIGSMHEKIELWDLGNGDRPPSLQNILDGHSLGVFSLHFTPDGQMLISRSLEETIKVWDLSNGKAIATLDSHAGPVWSEAISPDGQMLATGNLDESIKIWHLDRTSGELSTSEILSLNGHSDIVRCLEFSPDGKFLASGSADNTINLWHLDLHRRNHSIVSTLKGHSDVVHSVAFSPDGKFLASGSADKTIHIWRLGDRRNNYVPSLEATLTEHSGLVWAVKFSQNGKTLVSGSQDGTIKIWDRC